MTRIQTAIAYVATAFALIGLVCTGSGPALYRAMIGTSCDCDKCRGDRMPTPSMGEPVPDDEVAE